MTSLLLLVVFQNKVNLYGMICQGATRDGNEIDCDHRKVRFEGIVQNLVIIS